MIKKYAGYHVFDGEIAEPAPEEMEELEAQWQEYRHRLMEVVRSTVQAFYKAYESKSFRRAVHLAQHARKARTRRKNTRRVALTVLEVAKHV